MRWFQFSLRSFLVATTVFALCFGWTLERARQRERAIDVILAMGAEVLYERGEPFLDDRFYDDTRAAHLWPDLRRFPVEITLPEDVELDAVIGRYVEQAVPVQKLVIGHAIQDNALRYVKGLNQGCIVMFLDSQYLSAEALAELERRLPEVVISR